MRGKILFFVKCRACVLPHRLMATTWQRSPGCWSFLDARADFSLSGRLLDVLGLLSGPRAPILKGQVDKKEAFPRFFVYFRIHASRICPLRQTIGCFVLLSPTRALHFPNEPATSSNHCQMQCCSPHFHKYSRITLKKVNYTS